MKNMAKKLKEEDVHSACGIYVDSAFTRRIETRILAPLTQMQHGQKHPSSLAALAKFVEALAETFSNSSRCFVIILAGNRRN